MDLKKSALGIELGSTRIKAVLLDENHIPVATGGFDWENQLDNGIWTYPLSLVYEGVQTCFKNVAQDYKEKFGNDLTEVGCIGISAMMHGYLVFDKEENLLTPFRTWRNTITGEAAEKLTELFNYNIPQRWSIAHLYQAMLNKEDHVKNIDFITTLAGHIHYKLTGKKVMGIGEASGMFPIDSTALDFDGGMIEKFDKLVKEDGYPWTFRDIFPVVLCAGDDGGTLTEEGAKFLDPSGKLKANIPVAPCEGDAGTGMAATNSVRVGTGNVSAGTSDFAMLVTDKKLKVHREIDMVSTPDGLPCAMAHCNNCTSDINAWVSLFDEVTKTFGMDVDKNTLFTKLFEIALKGDADCGGLLSYNYYSGEGITDIDEGRPLFMRDPDSKFNLANFMRMHLLSAIATLKIGLDILTNEEKVVVEKLYGHGGFFKTPGVGSRMLSAAVNAKVYVMETAGEGGPYGMALLCAYRINKAEGESLADYLDNKVFNEAKVVDVMADQAEIDGFNKFLARYVGAFDVQRSAVEKF